MRHRSTPTLVAWSVAIGTLATGALFVLATTNLHAQAITGYVLKISTSAGAPVSTTPVPLSSVECGVAPKIPPASGGVVNPKRVVWDDPSSPAALDCVYTDPGAGPLSALPFGATAYLMVADAVNSVGTSPDSLPSNSFTRPGTVAPALTGVRVVP